jgi:hypothetical protein
VSSTAKAQLNLLNICDCNLADSDDSLLCLLYHR